MSIVTTKIFNYSASLFFFFILVLLCNEKPDILYGICNGYLPHFIFHCLLYAGKSAIQYIVDIAPYRAVCIRVLMKMEKLSIVHALNSIVNIKKGYFIHIPDNGSSPASPGYINQIGSFKLLENPSYHNGIDIYAFCQEITCYLVFILKNIDACEYMYCYSESA